MEYFELKAAVPAIGDIGCRFVSLVSRGKLHMKERGKPMWRSTLLGLMIHLVAASVSGQDAQQLCSAVENWVKKSGSETVAFRHSFTDLDGDGRAEALVLLRGNVWCGSGGCTMLVFRGTDAGFTFVS